MKRVVKMPGKEKNERVREDEKVCGKALSVNDVMHRTQVVL